jgi:hypothetical protein
MLVPAGTLHFRVVRGYDRREDASRRYSRPAHLAKELLKSAARMRRAPHAVRRAVVRTGEGWSSGVRGYCDMTGVQIVALGTRMGAVMSLAR